jgi:hypothetical protein
MLPSPFPESHSRREPVTSADSTSDIRMRMNESNSDWATFITAYAQGRWDPQRTPNPPRSYLFTPAHLMYPIPERSPSDSNSSGSLSHNTTVSAGGVVNSPPCLAMPRGHNLSSSNLTSPIPSDVAPFSAPATSVCQSAPPSVVGSERNTPLKLPSPSHHVRNSFADLRSPNNSACFPLDSDHASSASTTIPEVTAAAATMRWAGARVNLAPLSLPSPERELTDPMHGVTAAIPGSHSAKVSPGTELMTPGGTRKTRLGSFWQGTQDVEDDSSKLATIEVRPELVEQTSTESSETIVDDEVLPPPIASFPVPDFALHNSPTPTNDYFGDLDGHMSGLKEKPATVRRSTTPLNGVSSVPALPRRVCLTRQVSSPLPVSTNPELPLPGGRVASEGISVKAGRAAKEEQMFAELGYLAPPNPPDELERRRALHKYAFPLCIGTCN